MSRTYTQCDECSAIHHQLRYFSSDEKCNVRQRRGMMAMETASKHGCKPCKFLLVEIRTSLASQNWTPASDTIILEMSHRQMQVSAMTDLAPPPDGTTLHYERQRVVCKFSYYIRRTSPIQDDEIILLHGLEIVERETYASAISLEAVSLVQHWMRDCLSGRHEHCDSQHASQHFPTRLVAVGSDGEPPRLVTGDANCSIYAALSYCWGQGNMFVLRQGNLLDLQQFVPIDQLPQTIRDAIVYTRLLGITYLWVDSLCIIQDSQDDWAAEASKMGSIYTNATLTLAPLNAASASDGFLSTDNRRYSRGSLTELFSLPNSIGDPEIMIRSAVEQSIPRDTLHSRAWCLQERIFAPRMLYFTSQQVIWECHTRTIAEGSKLSKPYELEFSTEWSAVDSGAWWRQIFFGKRYGLPDGDGWPHGPENRTEALYYSWRLMVVEFKKRSITQEMDRLAAISALAKIVHRQTNDKYYAGIWHGDIFNSLLWQAVYRREDDFPPDPWNGLDGSQVPRPPSWSWVSCPSTVEFLVDHTGRKNITTKCRIATISTTQLTVDYFGMVQEGMIQLTGYKKWLTFDSRHRTFHWRFDDNRTVAPEYPHYYDCFIIGEDMMIDHHETYPATMLMGLILLKPGHDSRYRRIGTAQFFIDYPKTGRDVLKDWESDCTVTIE